MRSIFSFGVLVIVIFILAACRSAADGVDVAGDRLARSSLAPADGPAGGEAAGADSAKTLAREGGGDDSRKAMDVGSDAAAAMEAEPPARDSGGVSGAFGSTTEMGGLEPAAIAGAAGAGGERGGGGGGDAGTAADYGSLAAGGGGIGGGEPIDAAAIRLPATGHSAQAAYGGVLTAGTFDDSRNYGAYQDWTRRLRESVGVGVGASAYPGPNEAPDVTSLEQRSLGRLIEIRVLNESGGPVRGARVAVARGGSGEIDLTPLVQLVTHGDGRAFFFTELDGAPDTNDYVLAVTPPGEDSSVGRAVSTTDTVWEVVVTYDEPTLPSRLDLAFVVDATGSMSDELEYLKLEVGSIAEYVQSAFPGVDQRYALVVYRDEGDEYVTRVFDFTDSLEQFQTDLFAQRADGGGDYEEAVHAALTDAVRLSWLGADHETASVLFHIADAPPHSQQVIDTLDAAQDLRLAGVTVFPVGASGVADVAEYLMRTVALLTQGQYVFLTDDSGVGDPHAEPHIPCYHVEHLNDAMSRLIASELAGGPISPRPETIVRTIGHPVNGVCSSDGPDAQATQDGPTPSEPTPDAPTPGDATVSATTPEPTLEPTPDPRRQVP